MMIGEYLRSHGICAYPEVSYRLNDKQTACYKDIQRL